MYTVANLIYQNSCYKLYKKNIQYCVHIISYTIFLYMLNMYTNESIIVLLYLENWIIESERYPCEKQTYFTQRMFFGTVIQKKVKFIGKYSNKQNFPAKLPKQVVLPVQQRNRSTVQASWLCSIFKTQLLHEMVCKDKTIYIGCSKFISWSWTR